MTSPTERLDDNEVERLINLMDYRERRQGYSGPSGLATALRQRIRTLLEEARKEGVVKPCAVCTSTAEYQP